MHRNSINEALLSVLLELMKNPAFAEFSLGGGTSLALRFGHRRSIDIDLFVSNSFDTEHALDECTQSFEKIEILNRTTGSLCLTIDGTKVDFLHHAYPQLEEIETIDRIRMVSIPDIAAMKINAVTNRGSKKDFSDLYLFHRQGFELADCLDCFCKKYGPSSRFLAMRSLLWFDNADVEPDPIYLLDWTWQQVKDGIHRLATHLMNQK